MTLQRTIGNQAVLRLLRAQPGGAEPGRHVTPPLPASAIIQRKLAINSPGDVYEQQADRVADQVMRMPEPGIHSIPAAVSRPSAAMQRECSCGGTCADCQKKHRDEHAHVQMMAAGPYNVGGIEAPPIVRETLRSPGQPLGAATRAFMEPRFGRDFGSVRIHADPQAAQSAQAVNAEAYTVGHDIVFGAGRFAPATESGKGLLSHELTHVVQQTSVGDSPHKVVMRQSKPVEAHFSSCADDQRKLIDAAVQRAKKALNVAATVVASAYGRPDKLTSDHQKLLMEHFHTTNREHLRKVLGTYHSILRAFESGLKFQCETKCEKGQKGIVCGYAYATQFFGGMGLIHICFDHLGCDFTHATESDQTQLVIHEAAHRYAGIDDKKYVWESGYATLSAKEAMDNADSYARFAVLV